LTGINWYKNRLRNHIPTPTFNQRHKEQFS